MGAAMVLRGGLRLRPGSEAHQLAAPNEVFDGVAVRIIHAIATRLGVEFDAQTEIAAARKEAQAAAEQDLFAPPPAAPTQDRKSTRLNSSHSDRSRMPSSA